ncbi:hypothetical protein QMG90_03415 [Trabulsiella odontotermitis]|uniref:hypothetical protein n=1 Tax=Trabulsiella odontotermitis TaxID=379893 RepID=UPI0024B81B84|nr:hypothetical protein [Trabulsiella odontotermitis]WHP32006.1 hypothetical protein QMG90_03415 [Trabulsiella odontotermitis]
MINSSKEFIELRNSDFPAECNRAKIEGAPIEVWFELIEKYPDMRVWVARNKAIPREIIVYLSKDSDPIVRHAICSKYPLDMDIYLLFSKDPDEGIRSRLTFNKKLPLAILKEMSENDPSEFVRSQAIDKYKQRVS